jgi:ABC-type arginine transport system ATPase subunit
MSAQAIIEAKAVSKWYAQFHALKDINLTVHKGERIVHLRAIRLRQVDTDPLLQSPRSGLLAECARQKH